jgi:hypothetical protein
MLPQSKTSVDLSRRQIEILKLFPSFYDVITSKDIENALKIDRTTAFYHLRGKRKNEGLIGLGLLKIEKGRKPALYGLTVKGVKILRGILRGVLTFNTSDIVHNRKLCIRGHNIRLKSGLRFSTSINSLDLSRFNNLKSYQLASWEKFEGRFEGDYFCLTPNSIIFQPTERYGSPYLVLLGVFESARRLFKLLEEDNPGLKIEEDYTFITGQEWAFEGDEYAKACVKLGEEFNNARFGIDKSKGVELEFRGKAGGVDDAVKWKTNTERFVEGVIDDKIRAEDFLRIPELAARLALVEDRALSLLEDTLNDKAELLHYTEKFNAEFVRHDGVMGRIEAGLGKMEAKLDRFPDGIIGSVASPRPESPGLQAPQSTNLVLKPTNLVVDDKKDLGPEKVVKSVYDMSPAELQTFWAAKRGKRT